ncbi:MAG TPA: protein translocase subunit SecD [Aquifex sp.]|nr:protein translocase subunit SecD [Aquifex sp.]
MQRLKLHLILIFLVTVGAIWAVFTKPINYGLDLKGGIEIVIYPQLEKALLSQYEKYAVSLVNIFNSEGLPVLDYKVSTEGISFKVLGDSKKVVKIIKNYFGNIFDVEVKKDLYLLKLSEEQLKKFKETIITQTIEVLRKRVDNLGVVQAIVTRLGDKYIYIALPGVLDLERAKEIIGKTAKLEFLPVLEVAKDKKFLEELARKYKNTKILEGEDGFYYLVETSPVITGSDLTDAYPSSDRFGRPAVGFSLSPSASERFAHFTQTHIGKRMAIVLDNKVVSAPVIQAKIHDKGIITGRFTLQEVKNLVVILKGGALPTDLQIEEIRVIGPLLGKEAVKQGIWAFIGGIVLLTLILIWRYKMAGLTATLAVFHNALLLWVGLAILGATLTLPGIAGIILNMGIAVDSNVLIFERVKEELRKGATLLKALELGYKRALSAIVDSHVTLLVAALILSQFDAGPVKGFAVVLAIGTIASFFSNVYMSKILLDILARKKWVKFSL